MRNENIKLLSYSIILLSTSLIFGYIEAIFPINIGEIGVKIGLSNIVTIIGLKTIGIKKTLLINILRLIILGILFGNLVRFVLSVSGFLFSFFVMSTLIFKIDFSIISSSIFGGVSHNLGQFAAIILLMHNTKILFLLPIYIIIGIISGLIVGLISKLILNRLNFKRSSI